MTTTGAEADTYYWCLRHRRVESGSESSCPPEDRMGPYESREAAEHWKERVDARNDKWENDDKAWDGD